MVGAFGYDTGLDADVSSDFDRIGRTTPLLVDLKPSGQNYMEDLHKVGGPFGGALTNQRRAASLVSSARYHRCSIWTRRQSPGGLSARNCNGNRLRGTRASYGLCPTRSHRVRHLPCCAAISPPVAQSSSSRPCRLPFDRIGVERWCSKVPRTLPTGSTIRTSRWTRPACE